MAKLEDVLKANGYSDADIEAMGPMLADQKFRGSMEAHFSRLEAERDDYKGKYETYENWRETVANPHIAQQERIAAEARIDAAKAREEAKIARELGLFPKDDDTKKPPADLSVSGAFNPKDHKLVTEDDLAKGYARFSDLEGDAIASVGDLLEEYRYLSGGKSLIEYVDPTTGKKGLTALREEAKKRNMHVGDLVAQKFDFEGKRRAVSEAAQKAHDDKIRAEERAAMATQYGNPMLRTPSPSRQAFIPPKTETGGKFPWEQLPQERRNARLERAMKSQFTGQPN